MAMLLKEVDDADTLLTKVQLPCFNREGIARIIVQANNETTKRDQNAELHPK